MKKLVIMLKVGDRIINYLNIDDYTLLADIQYRLRLKHKLHLKEVVFGGIFIVYHPDMDFTNALNAGHKIIFDNRKHFNNQA